MSSSGSVGILAEIASVNLLGFKGWFSFQSAPSIRLMGGLLQIGQDLFTELSFVFPATVNIRGAGSCYSQRRFKIVWVVYMFSIRTEQVH